MTGLAAHVLRYWETEFEQLAPKKNRAGNRVFTERDIAVILRLQQLLRRDKYTIEGAKQVLQAEGGTHQPVQEFTRELLELRAFLSQLLKKL